MKALGAMIYAAARQAMHRIVDIFREENSELMGMRPAKAL